MDFSIKTSIGISSLVLLTSLGAKAANIVYAPAFCEPSELTLTAINKTTQPQRLWTQVRIADEIQEDFHDIAAKSELKIAGASFLHEKTGFSLKTWDKNSLQITATCDNSSSITLNDFTSPHVSHKLPAPVKTVKIYLLNLFLNANPVKLKAFNRLGFLLEEKQLTLEKYYDTTTLKWTLPDDLGHIEIEGQERLHSFLFYAASDGSEKNAPVLAKKTVSFQVDTSKTYFLVSTKTARPDESFVIALTDPQMIATAREQIKNKSLEKIVVAGIELGNGGFNRAFSSRDKSPYSWSVYRVDAFADFAHIDCDGSPDQTEERLLQKLNEGGRICFWRYRVTQELTPTQVATGAR